jgi:hypothetical protein
VNPIYAPAAIARRAGINYYPSAARRIRNHSSSFVVLRPNI